MAQIKKTKYGYQVRVSRGTGHFRHIINKTIKGTLKEANKYAHEIESQLDRGHSIYSLKSLLEYSEYWRSRIDIEQATNDFYENVIRLYASAMHDLPMFKVQTHHIQSVYDKLEVSSNTVRHLHATLRAMFNFAVKKRHLSENPVKFADPPKKKKSVVEYLDEHDAARLIAACPNSLRGLVFEFALETGMRPGEYLALRKKDIIYNNASVSRSLSKDGLRFGPPKTKSSRRLVSLSQPLLEKVLAHIDSHPFELLFCTGLGTPYAQNNITRDLNRIIKETGIKKISLYGLRHTMATLMLLGGENPKVVADKLGHSSVAITLDTYSHVMPHIQEAATDRLSVMLRGVAHPVRIQDSETSELIN